jgi:hypothetical protein
MLRLSKTSCSIVKLAIEGESEMPELRGEQATPEIKAEWERAYGFYEQAPGDPRDKKNDRTERINYVAQMMNLTHKQAKRRIRNYEAWQRNLKKGLVAS